MYKELTECLICRTSTLNQVVDLGNQYVVDFVKEKKEDLLRAPLTLMRCQNCGLVQLKYRVNPDRLYKKFWYRSGINESMRNQLLAIVQKATDSVQIEQGDKVLDIGCNDGTLLGWYDKRVMTVGIDPASDLVKEGMNSKRIDIGIDDYFSEKCISDSFNSLGMKKTGMSPKFKVITAISMFYDVEDPLGFLKQCKALLHDKGVLVIQMNYLLTMVKDTAFDNICHEHLTYFSVNTLKTILGKAKLYLQGVQLTNTNGGSIRAFITHPEFEDFYKHNHNEKLWLATSADMRVIEEIRTGLHTDSVYQVFNQDVENKMKGLREYLEKVPEGKLYGYGASTRGTVLLQYLYKDTECPIVAMAERDTNKYGLKMVGTWIPIIDEVEARSKASHMLVLPWHFHDSIVERETKWINEQKGILIFPLPKPHLAEHLDEPVLSSTRSL